MTRSFEGAAIGLGIISVLLWIVAQVQMASVCELRQEAIDRGFAEYNSKTGEWQWIEEDWEAE